MQIHSIHTVTAALVYGDMQHLLSELVEKLQTFRVTPFWAHYILVPKKTYVVICIEEPK